MIRLENVTCAYSGQSVPVLRGASLRIAPGRLALLQGGSGGGKSTVVRLLCGVIPTLQHASLTGRVLVDGREVSGAPLHETGRALATVFQDCRSQFFMTHVDEELTFAANNYGRPAAETAVRLERYAALMDVERLMDRSVFRLSSGERQRVAIAAAAIQGAPALALDEPSANLDAVGLRRLADLLRALKAEGRAILVADHRSAWLGGLIDERLRIDCGVIVPALADAAMQSRPHEAEPSTAGGSALLELRGAILRRRGSELLQGADFTLRSGELLAVCGSNGAGKTTLLRVLCGLERPDLGQALLEGRRARQGELRRACALVMQDPDYQLFAPSVAEEIGLGLRDKGETQRDLAERFGLGGVLDRHPGSLSMGQKQRTLIAAALAAGRRILLLDEPTSGMDPGRMVQLAQELRQWAHSGGAAVVVTHDEEFIASAGAQRLLLQNGRLAPQRLAGEE
jgi:energy-coupling factor transport system ATP-binding protein